MKNYYVETASYDVLAIMFNKKQYDELMEIGNTEYWKDFLLTVLKAKKNNGVFVANYGIIEKE